MAKKLYPPGSSERQFSSAKVTDLFQRTFALSILDEIFYMAVIHEFSHPEGARAAVVSTTPWSIQHKAVSSFLPTKTGMASRRSDVSCSRRAQ